MQSVWILHADRERRRQMNGTYNFGDARCDIATMESGLLRTEVTVDGITIEHFCSDRGNAYRWVVEHTNDRTIADTRAIIQFLRARIAKDEETAFFVEGVYEGNEDAYISDYIEDYEVMRYGDERIIHKRYTDRYYTLDAERYGKRWFALQRDPSDPWYNGTYDYDRAVLMLLEQRCGRIAVIDEETDTCEGEIRYEDVKGE